MCLFEATWKIHPSFISGKTFPIIVISSYNRLEERETSTLFRFSTANLHLFLNPQACVDLPWLLFTRKSAKLLPQQRFPLPNQHLISGCSPGSLELLPLSKGCPGDSLSTDGSFLRRSLSVFRMNIDIETKY